MSKRSTILTAVVLPILALLITAALVFLPSSFDGQKSSEKAENNLFTNGLLRVLKDGKWGFINESGKFILEPQFDDIGDFADCGIAYVLVTVDGTDKLGYINEKGEIIVQPQYDNHYRYNFYDDGYAIVYDKQTNKYGVINSSGEVIAEPQFEAINEPYFI